SVNIPNGSITVKPGSLVFTVTNRDTTAVFNLFDQGRGSVNVSINGQSFQVSPGYALILTYDSTPSFAATDPLANIGYRNAKPYSTTPGVKVFTAEFSFPTAMSGIASLRMLLHSKNKEDLKLARHLIKTAAAMSVIRPGQPFHPLR